MLGKLEHVSLLGSPMSPRAQVQSARSSLCTAFPVAGCWWPRTWLPVLLGAPGGLCDTGHLRMSLSASSFVLPQFCCSVLIWLSRSGHSSRHPIEVERENQSLLMLHSFPRLWQKGSLTTLAKLLSTLLAHSFQLVPFSVTNAHISYLSQRKEETSSKTHYFPSIGFMLDILHLPLHVHSTRGSNPRPTGHVQPKMAMNTAQHKIINSLKTFFFAYQFSLVFVYLMCGPRQVFFQGGPELPFVTMGSFTTYRCLSLTLPSYLFVDIPFFVSSLVSSVTPLILPLVHFLPTAWQSYFLAMTSVCMYIS